MIYMLNAFNKKWEYEGGYGWLFDMMKKKYIIYLVILCALIVAYALFFSRNLPKFNTNHIQTITFVTLPSPPKQKHLTKTEDVHKFLECYNKLNGKPILFQMAKGWMATIKLSNGNGTRYNIVILGNTMKVNGLWYEVDEDAMKELLGLYKTFDVEETSYHYEREQ